MTLKLGMYSKSPGCDSKIHPKKSNWLLCNVFAYDLGRNIWWKLHPALLKKARSKSRFWSLVKKAVRRPLTMNAWCVSLVTTLATCKMRVRRWNTWKRCRKRGRVPGMMAETWRVAGRGYVKKEVLYLENIGKYHLFRQLWLFYFIGVQLMEIDSSLFSEGMVLGIY